MTMVHDSMDQMHSSKVANFDRVANVLPFPIMSGQAWSLEQEVICVVEGKRQIIFLLVFGLRLMIMTKFLHRRPYLDQHESSSGVAYG